jgi:acyl-CoA reductase-like NAD-dependent aldehyde dehydrogenase
MTKAHAPLRLVADNDAVPPGPPGPSPEEVIARARIRQPEWARTPLRERLRCLRRFRALLAADAPELAATIERRPVVETIAAEIMPLLDACRFIERAAPRLLAPRRPRARGLPLPGRVRVSIEREPYGVVLVIGPGNYGLMLAAVQALQAIAAGNAVVVKPAPGARAALARCAALLERSGVPRHVLSVVDESTETARALLDGAIDRVVFTGSNGTGRDVLGRIGSRLVPAALELSGWDPCVVLDDADPELVAAALAFALRFNGGETCVAPRRVFVGTALNESIESALTGRLAAIDAIAFNAGISLRVTALVSDAIARGARLLAGRITEVSATGPIALAGVTPDMPIWSTELFGPILLIHEYADLDAAIAEANRSDFLLGASVFGNEPQALAVADRLRAGLVTVNDVIFPLADPQVPLSARGASGFGVTRGAEGLLAMTRPKAMTRPRSQRAARLAFELEPPAALLTAYAIVAHGRGFATRMRALMDVLRAARQYMANGAVQR